MLSNKKVKFILIALAICFTTTPLLSFAGSEPDWESIMMLSGH
jgi:hypothetical protein